MIGKLLEEGAAVLREKHIDFAGRAETGSAVRMAREYFDSLAIEARVIDSVEASTETAFFGHTFASPIMPAALSGLGGVWPNGMAEVAKAAAAARVMMWAGIGTDEELAQIAQAGARTVKIIKPYADHDIIFDKMKQAEKLGALAVGMDTIFGYGGKKGDTLIQPKPLRPKTSADLKAFIGATGLPFIVKGVLSARDAEKAAAAGAAAIVVSGHAGSVLDYAVPPLRVLPDIAKAVGRGIPILIDGGFTRGTDVFKALALGADGVLVGRALICGLAAGGAEGARKLLEGMNEELRRVMSLTGSPDVKNIDPSVVWKMQGSGPDHFWPQ
ncbi:MAG: alpha-hydroxy-acid oxidizing protein [Clostridiales Family XIII bacterium]|nr:alpha-hydroxy-acid oxidizing protein [Clostridiales Family XIII bacterium]